MLTLVELSGLRLVIMISFFAIAGGNADFSRVIAFETHDPSRIFPRIMLIGLGRHPIRIALRRG